MDLGRTGGCCGEDGSLAGRMEHAFRYVDSLHGCLPLRDLVGMLNEGANEGDS